jgi:Leucine-rich repeat (LRR) protein
MKIRVCSPLGTVRIILLAGILGLFSGTATWAQVVHFPDANLEAAVRDALGIPSPTPITTGDMATLREFNASNRGIADTTGLEWAVNLTNLVFNNNAVTTFGGIAALAKLQRLEMNSASLTSLGFLSALDKLEFLQLYSNQIEDITPLAGLFDLTNLDTLSLAGNGASNLNFIAPLTQLTHVGLLYKVLNWFAPNPTLVTIQLLEGRGAIVDYDPQTSAAIFLVAPDATGPFQFTVNSVPGSVLEILSSTNLVNWVSEGWVTNAAGAVDVRELSAPGAHKVYRARSQP